MVLFRIAHITVYGWLRFAVAVAVFFCTMLTKMVFALIPAVIMSKLDFLRSTKLFPNIRLFRGFQDDAESATIDMSSPELIKFFGYPCEEHTIYTTDGYVLTYHRIPRGRNDSADDTRPRPPVFVMHGLMQCSEAWVCHSDSLAFTMADSGFDVWIGNNRGNKYGHKHIKLKPSQQEFWNFSIDEFARYDIPSGISYILGHTGFKTLTYVGFSQGSAQAFACFATLHDVAAKVNLFIALSPAAKAQGLTRGMLSTFVKMAPQSVFLFFGTKAMWSSIFFYRTVLSRSFFCRSLDTSCQQLFGWNMQQIGDLKRKERMYPHLYSYTSVKNVVHWFQIVAQNRFQQYDDDDYLFRNKYEDIASHYYPIEQIKCPIAIFYGGVDYLTDVKWLISVLPRGSIVRRIEDYEHLDMMWATSATTKVFPDVMQLAREASEKKNSKLDTDRVF
jgi:lysosomal acid lipase/cholesteryl ester hydrolase